MTSVECLAKAAELEALAVRYPDDGDRADYIRTANGWRRKAMMAREREVWATLALPRRM